VFIIIWSDTLEIGIIGKLLNLHYVCLLNHFDLNFFWMRYRMQLLEMSLSR